MRRSKLTGLLFMGAVVIIYAIARGHSADGASPPDALAAAWREGAEAVMRRAAVEEGEISFDGASRGVVVDLGAGTVAKVARLMPLGDSITAGTVTLDLRDTFGYREPMWRLAVEAGGVLDFVGPERTGQRGPADPDHAGFPGRTMRWAIEHAPATVAEQAPDAVLLMMGTNDTSTSGVRHMLADLASLIQGIGAAAPSALLLKADPPPMRADAQPDWRTRRIRLFTMALPIVLTSQAGHVAALRHVSMPLTEDDISPPPADNGLHPTALGYCRMARAWTAALEQAGISAGLLAGRTPLAPGIRTVIGTAHNDRLVGDGGANHLLGGDGNDVLVPMGGGDHLWGGGGADLFILTQADLDSPVPVTIHDFDGMEGDRLEVSGLESALPPGGALHFDYGPGGTRLLVRRPGAGDRVVAEFPGVLLDQDAIYRPALTTACTPALAGLQTAGAP